MYLFVRDHQGVRGRVEVTETKFPEHENPGCCRTRLKPNTGSKNCEGQTCGVGVYMLRTEAPDPQ